MQSMTTGLQNLPNSLSPVEIVPEKHVETHEENIKNLESLHVMQALVVVVVLVLLSLLLILLLSLLLYSQR